jgi:hypothetical protein
MLNLMNLIEILFSCVQGLVPSLHEVCPHAEHRTCVRHLYANFKDDGHRGGVIEGPAVESCFILHTDWILY